MTLIHRRGCTFLIRSVRRDGRVTSEYVGSGPHAESAYATFRQLRDEREAEREAHRAAMAALLARLDAAQGPIRAYCADTDTLVRAAMEAAGYHRHKRGEWRRRRNNMISSHERKTSSFVSAAQRMLKGGISPSEIPDPIPFSDPAGVDPAEAAESALIRWAAGDDPVRQERLRRRLVEFRDEVAGENPTVLEKILAHRVALCWLEANAWDERLSRCDPLSVHGGCVPFVEHQERRRNAAHRRFNQAVRTLAVVRQKALPVGQVNVEQRVSVKGPLNRGQRRQSNRFTRMLSGSN